MKIHYLQHAPFEGPAYITAAAKNIGAELTGTHLFEGRRPPDPYAFDLLFILGGPMGVHDEREYSWMALEKKLIEEALSLGKKIIGICLGGQLLAHVLGSEVRRNPFPEIGWFPVMRSDTALSARIGRVLPYAFHAFHWHNDVFAMPAGAVRLAASDATENQAFIYKERALGLQFHLESTEESIRQIYDNCDNEQDDGKYVQSREQAMKMNFIKESNSLFEAIFRDFISS